MAGTTMVKFKFGFNINIQLIFCRLNERFEDLLFKVLESWEEM